MRNGNNSSMRGARSRRLPFRARSLSGVLLPAFVLLSVLLAARTGLAGESWRTLSSPHFDVHFPAGTEAFAQEVARTAERARARLLAATGLPSPARTQIVIAAGSDLSNGATDVLLYNRILVEPAFPTPETSYESGLSPRTADWLEMLLLHEYAHVLQLTLTDETVDELRALFGHVPVASTPGLLAPPALIEGYAIFEETRLSDAGRGRDPYFDMFLRAAVLEGRIPPLDRYLGLYDLGRWQPTGTAYLFGYSVLSYVAATYGPERVIALIRAFVTGPGSL
ncbi:MAG TPA: hypothetical protein VF234_03075, partial [Limnochordia bacterium]